MSWKYCTVQPTVSGRTPWHKFPEYEATSVHVDTQEGILVKVDGTLQDLWGHVTPRAHLGEKTNTLYYLCPTVQPLY